MKNRIGRILGIIFVGALLSGCRATELEDRTFPMMAAVDYDEEKQVGFTYVFPVLRAEPDAAAQAGEDEVAMNYAPDFGQACQAYEASLNKEADYNHLKVLLLGTAFMEEPQQCREMLEFLWEEETFPRNTYVCVTDDVQGVILAGESQTADAGTYIEELLENHEFGEEEKLPTLGTLLDEQKNQVLPLRLPFLSVQDKTVVWTAFYEVPVDWWKNAEETEL